MSTCGQCGRVCRDGWEAEASRHCGFQCWAQEFEPDATEFVPPDRSLKVQPGKVVTMIGFVLDVVFG